MSKYNELKEITQPVLLTVKSNWCTKYRILLPDGSCIYCFDDDTEFSRCCFNFTYKYKYTMDNIPEPAFKSLKQAVDQMESYDKCVSNKITKITKL